MNKLLNSLSNSKCAKKIKTHPMFKKYPSLEQMTKFAVIGCFNNVIDFTIYIFLTRGFPFWRTHYLWANFAAFMISISATFDMVRVWIFKLPVLPSDDKEATEMKLTKEDEKVIHIQYFKFLLVSCIAFMFNQSGLFVFVEFFKFHDILSKAAVGIVLWIIRFNFHRFWTFKSNIKKDE